MTANEDDIRDEVRERYGAIAAGKQSSCCGSGESSVEASSCCGTKVVWSYRIEARKP